ncbi:MAG: GldG family protein, partial [Oceanipulchritudo sp.]
MRFWESYQVVNRLKQVNYWVQVLLIVTFIFGLNYLALHHFVRIDLTQNHRYALSPETKAYISEIREPIRFIVTIPENSPRPEERVLFRYTEQLLREYAYQSRHKGEFLISVEYVDIYKDLNRADSLAREFGLEQVNSLLVLSRERKRLLSADELVSFANREPVAFTGEAAITSAIMEVTREQSPKLYFLSGHQETNPENASPQSGLSEISRELQMRNYSISRLDLTAVAEVPADAAALVLAERFSSTVMIRPLRA